jgi:uncharacterized protein
MRIFVAGLAALLLVITALLTLVWFGQRRMMYFPFGAPPAPREAGLTRVEEVKIQTDDGLALGGWFVPAASAPAAFTAIVFNGNAGNRAFRAPLASALNAHNIAVLLFDYRGFGGNAGSPTETGLASDARAARAYLASRSDVDQSRIMYFGESLGTAVATTLAAEQPPAALILRSPFASMADIGQLHYPILPVRWLLRDRYAARDAIAHVRAPVLVIAGERDAIVPLTESRKLFEAASPPKELVIIRGADHNDQALLSGREMIEAIVTFLRSVH